MKYWFVVSFRYSENVYCTNLCFAESKEKAEEHYNKKYEWVSVTPATDGEVNSYERRGMPITTL